MCNIGSHKTVLVVFVPLKKSKRKCFAHLLVGYWNTLNMSGFTKAADSLLLFIHSFHTDLLHLLFC